MIETEEILERANNLPALPGIVHEILKMIDNPDATAKDFQNLIMPDPILVSRILRLANSAYYGYSREILTISEAIIIIGLDTLKSLVIAISAHGLLNKTFDGYKMKRGDLWKHSLFCAMLSRLIVKNLYMQDTEKYFIGGLLHDIGKLLLNSYITKYYSDIEKYIKQNNSTFHIAEKMILGMDHAEAGCQLVYVWKLPALFIDIIKYHHIPNAINNDNRLAVSIIYAANIITNNIGYIYGRDESFVHEDKEIFAELNLDRKTIITITDQIKTEINEFNKFLEIT